MCVWVGAPQKKEFLTLFKIENVSFTQWQFLKSDSHLPKKFVLFASMKLL